MDIQSPRTCMVIGDIVSVECTKPNKPNYLQERHYYIARKDACNGHASYLAVRLQGEGHVLELSTQNNEGKPVFTILNQDIDNQAGCANTVTGKIANATLCVGSRQIIRQMLATDPIVQRYNETHAGRQKKLEHYGRCSDYGKLQVGAGDDNRDRAFLESHGHKPWEKSSPRFADAVATVGDAVGAKQIAQMASTVEDDRNNGLPAAEI